ncbi:MAG: hypothetical protein HKN12_00755 [Gemmatimonadetes bacterium]|nr:hypothetical protein [Gemmatimonadota bacterium]
MDTKDSVSTWPDLAIGLYDRLTGRQAEITYEMDDLQVMIPAGTAPEARTAPWTFNGRLRISTKERAQ